MLRHRRAIFIIIAASLLLAGSVARADTGYGSWTPTYIDYSYPSSGFSLRRIIGNWVSLAGRDLNGVSLNGTVLNGQRVVKVSLKGVTIKGKKLGKAWLWGSRLFPLLGKGMFKGAVMSGTLDNGKSLDLRVDSVARGTTKANKDIYYYDVSYPTQSGYRPLCGLDDKGQPVPAIPLRGRWDYREGVAGGGDYIKDKWAFTFACVGHVLAKCAEAGYKPWKKVTVCVKKKGCKKVDLAKHHQACTRMLRADYCGDGTSHTVDNMDVNMYDAMGLRTDSEKWGFEAEWDAKGAICADTSRLPNTPPSCASKLMEKGCGNTKNFSKGTLLFSEIPTP